MGRLKSKFVIGIVTPIQEVPGGSINGTNTTFTLSFTPSAAAALIIAIDGVIIPSTEYTYSGTTLTLATAPVVGQTILAYYSK